MPYCGLPGDPEELFEFEPEELAMCLLRHLVAADEPVISETRRPRSGRPAHIPSDLFSRNRLEHHYPSEHTPEVEFRLAEAWAWLVARGLVVRSLEDRYPKFAVSRRGVAAVSSSESEREFLASTQLPRQLLHPEIQRRSWPDYIRADFSGAVFKALRAVEVAVREASGLPANKIGVDLVLEAFKPHTGKLAAPHDPEPEQIALRRLFAGTIGSYKNPSSHRHVDLTAQEAGEMLVLASHLMGIVDARGSWSAE